MRHALIVPGIVLSVSVCSFGRVISVAAGGSGEYATIQAAMDAAVDGDEIEVRPGTYAGVVDFAGKAVRLYSSDGPEVTTIAGAYVEPFTENFDDGDYDGWEIVDQGNWDGPSAWSAAGGEMVQSSNIYTEPTTDQRYLGTYALSPAIPWDVYELSLTMKSDDDDWMGVMFCYRGPSNYYRFAWSKQLGQRQLVRYEDGVFETVRSNSAAYVTGQTYSIRILVDEWGWIRVFVDGEFVFSWNDDGPRDGRIGLYCWGNQGTHFDDIVVRPSAAALSAIQCVSGEGPGTVVEGFTVTSPLDEGRCDFGMTNAGSGPTVRNSVFDGFVSGIRDIESTAAITGCTFRNCSAEVGGGVYNIDSDATVTECLFENNSPDDLVNSGGSPRIERCIFAAWSGGVKNSYTNATITGCSFTRSAFENQGASSAAVVNCTFSATTLYNSYGSTATVVNCVFTGCDGAMENYQSSPTVTNCTFVRNGPDWYYGTGGAMLNRSSRPVVTNCIIRENGALAIDDRDGSVTSVTYSNVEGGWSGEGNINEDAAFVDADAGDFRLRWYSPCVDAGSDAAAAGIGPDLDGNPRVADGNLDGAAAVDMGAYEAVTASESLGTSLEVTIEPQEAVDAGAGWRLAGEVDWRASGETVSGLTPGYYEVEYGPLDAWFEPQAMHVCVERDLPVAKTAAYKPVGVYAIGQIPPGEVPHGGTLAFYVYSEVLGVPATLSASAAPMPAGAMTFDAQTGLFVYRPDDTADVLPFEVTFTATFGREVDEQAVRIMPVADLPAEYSLVSTPTQQIPNAESRDYLVVNEVASDADEVLNGLSRRVRSVTIAGETVVFEPGHASGLYEAYSSPPGGPYKADIEEMTICAETLVIGGPLHLPQTRVRVYARRLELRGADALLSTVPCDQRTVEPGPALAGLDGGDIELHISSLSVVQADGRWFRASGTAGHNGGAWGKTGNVMHTLHTRAPLAWIAPYSVKMVLARARDMYLSGHTAEAHMKLAEYRELLGATMGLDSWEGLDLQQQLEIEQMHGEVATLLHRLESGLDYFGNPPGWTPMLSFEITKAFYEQEIDRAVRVLYLSYWVQNKAASIEQKAAALSRSRQAAWDEAQAFADQYTQVQALIPKLKSDAERIAAQIGRADAGGCSGLLCQLKKKEEELIARADRIVQKRHEVPWWKKLLKGLAGVVTSTIGGAASGGQAGAAAGFATGSITALTDTFLADEDPWPTINNRTGVAKTFYGTDFEAAAGDWLDNFETIPDNLNAVEASGAADYLQGLRAQAASMAASMHSIKESLRETSLSNEEVEAELKKIKAADPIFNSLVDQITQLAVEKEVFNRQLTAAIQKVSTLANGITNNLLAIDGMNRDTSHLNRVLDPRATMYVKDMERRALERLRKYHYYLARSYEYRLLAPSPMDLNVGNMFTAMQTIVSEDGQLSPTDFDALKTVYEAQLWDLTDRIYQDYQNNASLEATAPVRLELTPAQIADLNNGKEVIINLKDAARLQYNEENARIVDLIIKTMDYHDEGATWEDYFDLEIEHSGVSTLQKNGQIHRFVHYKDVTQESNPINWNVRCYIDSVEPVDRSQASESMLYSLLEDSPGTGTDIMLYARSALWSDLCIRKVTHEENVGEFVIDSLRLEIRYDRVLRPAGYTTLQVATEPKGLAPYFQVSREDRYGRRDGVGEFCRTYNSGTVNVTAPLQGGHYTFVKWTDGGGNEVTQNTALSVTLDTNLKRIAHYVYTGPMPSAADFNADFIVDYGDFVGLAEMWHSQQGDPKWDAAYDISDPADGVIDVGDLLRMAEEWLVVP